MNLTNFSEHPADNRYMVYRFQVAEHAAHFETQISQAGVEFERHETEENGRDWILYGIHKSYLKDATQANRMTAAKYREKFIPNRLFRNLVLIIGIGVTLLAIISYFMQR